MYKGKSGLDSEMVETSGEVLSGSSDEEGHHTYENPAVSNHYDEPATIETSMEEKDVQANLNKLPPLTKFAPKDSTDKDKLTDL